MAASSIGFEYTGNFIVKAQTGNGNVLVDADVTIVTSEETYTGTTDAEGLFSVYVFSSQTVTITINFDGVPQVQNYDYTFTGDLTFYTFSFPIPLRFTNQCPNNYIRWFSPSDAFTIEEIREVLIDDCSLPVDDQTGTVGQEYSASLYQQQVSVPVTLVENIEFSFYANLSTLEDSANFASWRVDIISTDFYQLQFGAITLTKDIISGSDYRFYATGQTIGGLTERAQYRFIIVDTVTNTIVYVSNIWQYREEKPYFRDSVKPIRYRNDKNIFNYNYEVLTSFKNTFYVDVFVREPRKIVNQIGYQLISGSFKPVRSTSGTQYKFITQAYNAEDMEAFNAVTLHNTFEVNIDGNYSVFTRGENDYQQEWLERNQLGDGEILLEKVDSFSSNKSV